MVTASSRSRGSRRSLVLPSLLALAVGGVAPALVACHRDTSSTQLTSAASSATPAGNGAKAAPIPDADIAQAITRHLAADPALHSESEPVKAAVTSGICTLSGSVSSLLAKERALRVAETLKGVRSVIDQVEVKPVFRSDAQLKGDVTRELARENGTRAHAIDVAAKDGKVTLSGAATSWPEHAFVEQVVKSVKGVKSIDDQITVKYPLVPSEAQIATDVKHRIGNDIWLDGNPIDVTVTGHTVHLKGTVGSVAEKSRARSDGWLAGVDAVDDSGVAVDWAARDEQRHVIDYAFRSDTDIASAIRDAFKLDPRLVTLEPKVAVHTGIVELTGTVDSAAARHAAELDAKDTVGVTDVHDLATVAPIGRLTDADIDRSVKRALSDDLFLPDSKDIHASSSKGKVVLAGDIKSGFERFDALEDTASIPGVTEIVDQMQLKRSAQDIKADIDDRIFWDATVERNRVQVAVAPDGVATLTGTLYSGSEIRGAIEDATLGGAPRVVNLLQLAKPRARH